MRSALSGVLRDEGYDVEAVDSGEACLDRVSRAPVRRDRAGYLAARHGRARHAGAVARAAGRCAGGDDLRSRQHRVGGPRDQAGRVRLRREAALAREDGAGGRQRRPPAPARSREPRAARPERSPPDDGGGERGDDPAARAGGDGRADQRPRPHLRRERHRQGAGRAQRPRHEPAARRAVRRGQLRGDSRGADRERAVRAREGIVHRRDRGSPRQVRARRRRHAVPRRDRRHEPEDPGQGAARACRSRSSSRWAARPACASTSGSWPRPTRI